MATNAEWSLSGPDAGPDDWLSLDIEFESMAHSLASGARWNGQITGSWAMSVAEHSLLVEK